jgi:Tfp pilus assembly protein PilO
MIKFSKTQRDRLILIALVTGIVAVFVWNDVNTQRQALARKTVHLSEVLQSIRSSARQSALTNKLQRDLQASIAAIRRAESNMPAGDIYRWVINRLVELPTANGVELATVEPPEIRETSIFPRLPYRTGMFLVTGSAYYHELGAFIAQAENTFPHLRVRHLELEAKNSSFSAADSQTEPDDEKLLFRLELSFLIRTNSVLPGLSVSAVR